MNTQSCDRIAKVNQNNGNSDNKVGSLEAKGLMSRAVRQQTQTLTMQLLALTDRAALD